MGHRNARNVVADREARAARELLLSSDDISSPGQVREDIESSWRRCQLSGVAASSDDVPYNPEFDSQSRLLRAATPVLDVLTEQLADIRVSILLADARARIIDRRTGSAGLLDLLDREKIAPGFGYQEDIIGTNGLGTALEERRPFTVSGGEHFRENLQEFSCTGVPLRNPLSGAMAGVIDVTCAVRDESPLILPLVHATARDIENRLYAEASFRERLLFEHFLRVTHRTGNAVIALNQELIFTNVAAAGLVDRGDHAVLWDQVGRMLANRNAWAGELRLRDGLVTKARFTRIEEAPRLIGVVAEMCATAPAASPVRSGGGQRSLPGLLPGRSTAWLRCREALETAARGSLPVLIAGESGTGKLAIARSLLAARGVADAAVIDCAAAAGDVGDWLGRLHAVEDSGVVLRHIDALPTELEDRVAAILETSRGRRATLAATIRVGSARRGSGRARDHFGLRIDVPPLRHRPEDLSDIAPVLLARHARHIRLQPAALQILMRLDWPGNLRELDTVLSTAALNSHHCDIGVKDLPEAYHAAPAPYQFTSLERAERDVILRILRDTGGNKVVAAQQLGIARSTLYRKLRALGIDDTCLDAV